MTFARVLRFRGMTRAKFLPLALIAVAVAGTPAATAGAAIKNPKADAAMRKGIRDVARISAEGARASKIHITCAPVKKVNDKGACTGTFRLTKGARSADYTLTTKARVFRISPGAIEYRAYSKARHKVAGLPGSTALMGFYQ
ncbi:MAG: hypothetical protein JWQ20_1079 [Conexibacter sp.]|nr:hypothetical protein [Conexibacter sp.]